MPDLKSLTEFCISNMRRHYIHSLSALFPVAWVIIIKNDNYNYKPCTQKTYWSETLGAHSPSKKIHVHHVDGLGIFLCLGRASGQPIPQSSLTRPCPTTPSAQARSFACPIWDSFQTLNFLPNTNMRIHRALILMLKVNHGRIEFYWQPAFADASSASRVYTRSSVSQFIQQLSLQYILRLYSPIHIVQ